MNLEPVIGLEVHVQLNTKTKIFCSCSNKFGDAPNTNTCPVCQGHPGVLPVFNKQVLDMAIMAGIALHCEIASFTKFDRKNYFYPDLPKAYQISQFDKPVCTNGYLEIEKSDGSSKKLGITRIHMEEDAGKLIHSEDNTNLSFVDLNRCGTPLLEIVSEPDMRSPEEAYLYLTKLKNVLRYLDVSDCNMEEGSLRCDVNISLRPFGQKEFGTKTEIKNINTFKGVLKALDYEIERQTEELQSGGRIVQETRLFNLDTGITRSMRSKEEAHDYRYFPEPDLVPYIISKDKIEEIRALIPELQTDKIKRYLSEYELPEYDAKVITENRAIAQYFENLVAVVPEFPKKASNWVMEDVLRSLKELNMEIEVFPVSPDKLGTIIQLIEKKEISRGQAKTIFNKIIETGKTVEEIIDQLGLKQISDSSALEGIVQKVIANNPGPVEEFKNGKEKAIGFLMGQAMKESKGKANPQVIREMLIKAIK